MNPTAAPQRATHKRQRLVCGLSSERGGRAQNEDASAWYDTEQGIVAIVADGMGGGLDGSLFSNRAVSRLQAHLISAGDKADQPELERAVQSVAQELHTLRMSEPRYHASGTTLIVASVKFEQNNAKALIIHIGDSRGYLISANGQAQPLTRDHTHAEALIREGTPPAEAHRHPQASRLTYALGDELTLDGVPDAISTAMLKPNDRLLLCTDGVSKFVAPKELAEIALGRPAAEAARLITERAIKNGSKDNVTALLIHYQPQPRQPAYGLIGMVAVVCLLLLIGAIFAIGPARAYLTAPTPTSNAPLLVDATITPLPIATATIPAPTRTSVLVAETSTSGPSITPTATATPSPSPTPTLIPTRPVLVPSATLISVTPNAEVPSAATPETGAPTAEATPTAPDAGAPTAEATPTAPDAGAPTAEAIPTSTETPIPTAEVGSPVLPTEPPTPLSPSP